MTCCALSGGTSSRRTEASWGKDDVLEAVLTVVREHHFHPVRDYLDGLKWDGVPRIDGLFTRYAGAKDTPYVRAIYAKALIAAVRRVRQPGASSTTSSCWRALSRAAGRARSSSC